MRQHRGPVGENPLRLRTAGAPGVLLDQQGNHAHIVGTHHRLQIDRSEVAALLVEITLLVIDVSDTAAHAGGEVSAAVAQHHDRATGHVLATMIANAFDHGGGT